MTPQEKRLYHQIHPLKLATDWSTGIIALVLLWHHALVTAVIVGVVPSAVVSVLLIRYADLEPYKSSSFGRYVAQHMTQTAEAARLGGFLVMATGSWWHLSWLIAPGLLVILSGWSWGFLLRRGQS